MAKTLPRSDVEILDDVHRELKWDTRIQGTDIGVEVDQGVVTLTGTADSYVEKDAAEEAAHRVRDVHDVANDIVVRLAGTRGHAGTDVAAVRNPDTDIAVAVRRALSEDPVVAAEHIETTVSHGGVMLSGQVKSWQQQMEAAHDVRRVVGVSDVTNNIVIRAEPVSPDDVRKATQKALERRAECTAAEIGVAVDSDGTVTLTGNVQSSQERGVVIDAAQHVPGVWNVDDQLRIEAQT